MMKDLKHIQTALQDHFFKDKHGKVVLWQRPNILLSIWILAILVIQILPESHLKSGIAQLNPAVLFAWAYLELTSGVNYFRKSVGLVVLGAVITGYLK